MSPLKNFESYRNKLYELVQRNLEPYIPYFGLFLSDLIFLNETSFWKNQDLINFSKIKNIGNLLLEFQKIQEISWKYKTIIISKNEIQNSFLSYEIWDENDLRRLAKLYEGQNDDIYIPKYEFKNFIYGRSNIATDVDSLTTREWNLLLTNATTLIVKKGSIILEEGTINEYLYKIKKGSFGFFKKKNGELKLLKELYAPSIFGEMSFLENLPTSASIICNSDDSELYILGIKLLKKIFSTNYDLFRNFYQYLATILAKRLKNLSNSKNQQENKDEKKDEEKKYEEKKKYIKQKESKKNIQQLLIESKNNYYLAKPNIKAKKMLGIEIREEDIKFRKKFSLNDSEIIIKGYI